MSRLPSINPRDLSDSAADDARVERIWKRVRDDLPVSTQSALAPTTSQSSRRGVRVTLLFAAAFGMFATGLVIGRVGNVAPSETSDVAQATTDGTMTDVFAAGSRERSFTLPGGGRIHLEPDSMVEVVEVSGSLLKLSLLRGAATLESAGFDVEVAAGEARITAPAGASVSLARRESDLDVLVAAGSTSVDVTWPAGHDVVTGGHTLPHVPTVATLSANQVPPQQIERRSPDPVVAHDRVSPTAPDLQASTPQSPNPAADPPNGPPSIAVDAAPSWMSLYQNGKTAEAYSLIGKGAGLEATIKTAQSSNQLWALWELAEDQKSNLAVLALRRLVDEFGSDPDSAVAALQLADIYESTDKQLAAKYRDKAAQAKGLAEVALCGEVRAAIDAGDKADLQRAAQIASKYLKEYPKGTCAADAKTLLEDASSKLGPTQSTEPDKSSDKSPEKASDKSPEKDKPADASKEKKDPGAQPSASQKPAPKPAPSASAAPSASPKPATSSKP